MSLKTEIYADYRRYRAAGMYSIVHVILFSQGFCAICIYRIVRAVMSKATMPGVRTIANLFCSLADTWAESHTGIGLLRGCEIGPGVCIFHFGPTVVHNATKMGSNCNLRQGVTIGAAGRGERYGAPTIGNRVDIGANATIIGKITIGNDVAIGAGSVVTKSVPDRGVVAGNPARLLSNNGSFDFVVYDNMENDPDRLASLEQRDQERREVTKESS